MLRQQLPGRERKTTETDNRQAMDRQQTDDKLMTDRDRQTTDRPTNDKLQTDRGCVSGNGTHSLLHRTPHQLVPNYASLQGPLSLSPLQPVSNLLWGWLFKVPLCIGSILYHPCLPFPPWLLNSYLPETSETDITSSVSFLLSLHSNSSFFWNNLVL